MSMRDYREVIQFLIKNKITISVCESLTGGLLASHIVSVPGSSSIFSLGLVTYSIDMKVKFLNVNEETINKFDVVSKEVVEEMVLGLEKQIKSDIYISTSGYAGPTGLNVGKCCFAIKYKDNLYSFISQYNNLDRNELREKFVLDIFNKLSEIIV